MKPGSNMQLSKKSLAEELAGRLQGQFMSGKFVERLTPPDEPMERRLGRADLHDLDEVRKILEVAIAEKAAERRTAHDAAVLEKHLAERGATAAAGALQACIEADVNFHIALAEATHNEIHGQLLGYILAGDVRNAREAITRILEEP